jgi:hypothetical protein
MPNRTLVPQAYWCPRSEAAALSVRSSAPVVDVRVVRLYGLGWWRPEAVIVEGTRGYEDARARLQDQLDRSSRSRPRDGLGGYVLLGEVGPGGAVLLQAGWRATGRAIPARVLAGVLEPTSDGCRLVGRWQANPDVARPQAEWLWRVGLLGALFLAAAVLAGLSTAIGCSLLMCLMVASVPELKMRQAARIESWVIRRVSRSLGRPQD